ncbi:uridine kinase [Thalassotalea sp. PS06]|uniref:uridine kinase n=1 Tax=Thalassotalea sp. PS06 TaxID=2594005 RepID=UPI00163D6F56|nr:uridine kinase [Thalassotalea sp. PS06]
MENYESIDKVKFISVTGASGSGKSTFARKLCDSINSYWGIGTASVISEDEYYKCLKDLEPVQVGSYNFDNPLSIEHDKLLSDLEQLEKKLSIKINEYCFSSHSKLDTFKYIDPTKIVIVEGLFLLTNEHLKTKFSLNIFIDTPIDICLLRRIERDLKARGRDIQSISNQYRHTVRNALFEFILPTRQEADVRIDTSKSHNNIVRLLTSSILTDAFVS